MNAVTKNFRWLAPWLLLAAPVLAAPEDDQFAVAAGHYSDSRWEQAAAEFRYYLQEFPAGRQAADAAFFLGESLVQLERYGEAQQYFAEIVDKHPGHRYVVRSLFRAGEAAHLSGRRDEARRRLTSFIEQRPRDRLGAFAYPYLAEEMLFAGDAQQAVQLYAAALREYPQGPLLDDCRFGMARALESQGQTRDAERFYRLLSASKDALADDARLRLGILCYQQKHLADADEALSAFESPTGPLAESDLRVHALYWLGMVRLARGDSDTAVDAFDLAIEHEPQGALAPAILHASAAARLQAGDTSDADARYRRLYETWPRHELADDSLAARVQLAVDALREASEVLELVEKFEREFPGSDLYPQVRQALGRWRLTRDEFQAAEDIFAELTWERSPDDDDAPPPPPDLPRLGAPVAPEEQPLPRTTAPPRNDEQLEAALNLYYLALAQLGQRRHEETLATLDRVPSEIPPALLDGVRVARASALVGLERYQKALPHLRDYLESQPEGPDAARCRAHLAVALARLERFDESAAALQQLEVRHPGHALLLPTIEFVAEAAYRGKQIDLARRLFTILARDANPPRYVEKGRSGLAWLDFESNPQASAEEFQRLILEHPDAEQAAEAALMRARALEKIGKPHGAVEMYKLIIDKHADSPLLADAVLGAARLLDEQALDGEAAELLQRYVREFPKSEEIDTALYLWAWVLDDLGQPEQADDKFQRLADEHPQSKYWSDAVYRLAERAARGEDFDRADVLVARLIEADAKSEITAHALYLKGQIAAAREQWADVEPPLARLLVDFPDTTLRLPAEYWIAEATYRQGKFQRAGRLFTQLLVQTNDRHESWLGMIPLRLAQVHAHARQWDKAYELASGVARQYPDFRQQYEVDYLLGRCLQSRAEFDFDAARQAYQRVVRSETGGRTETAAMAQWMIGETYFLQKNYEQALRAYYRVEQLFDYPRWQSLALLQAGKCLEVQQQYTKAIEAYQHVQDKYADTSAAKDAARRIDVVRQRLSLREQTGARQ